VFIPLEPDNALQNGRFKIVRQLAFGGLSAIYLAQMNDLDLVVLKEAVVPKDADKQKQKEAEEHLIREAKLLTLLDHANITHVLDHFFEDGRHYLVLQYLNGQDLRQYVKQNGPVPQEKTIEWAITISDVLTYLHSQQPPIIHRDLTPDNLILTNKGDIVLIDFGAANQFLGAATGTIIGKQAYIPAEQLRGKAVLQSDIYALGCTINYLLTGQDPLPLATAHPKSILDNTDPALDQIVAKCTAFEPEGRYQDIAEVGRALKDLSSKEFII
jgi:serine/threonine-protein kinase